VTRLHATFRSLGNRNFRLFFTGQVVSASGTWMQKIGQAWLVLQLTDSGTLLGVVAALQQLPVLVLGAWCGLVADRVDKRRLLIVTQTVSGALALVLGILTAVGLVRFWIVLVLAVLLGVADAFDRPTRHTFISEMVGPGQLMNAISLNSVIMNASKSVGPALGGVLIAAVGLAPSFFLNAASYLAVIAGLLLMRQHELTVVAPARRAPGQVREGFRHARGTPAIAAPLFLVTAAGLVAYEWQTTLPLLAHDAFDGGAPIFGAMFSAMGIGAMVGGLAIAGSRATANRLLVAAAVFSGLLVAVSLAPVLPVALLALLLLGAGSSWLRSQATTLVQLGAEPQMRGRVMALVAVGTAGTTPLGGPLVGWIGETFGARSAFAFGGIGTAVATLVTLRYLRRRAARAVPLESVTPLLDEASPVPARVVSPTGAAVRPALGEQVAT
jgi:MFS family permease